ncbi:MAG: D-alanyl-D-alanine carboxypeptidase [Lachnospiraceae bacterium]|nr:D-alanyl-D-alanine carboxypeptidase [Lachnospiraceae bacterium]
MNTNVYGSVEDNITSKEAYLMEVSSKTVLAEKNSEERVSIASVTKIMTLLLTYDALESGKIKKDDLVTTSAYAKSMGGSQVFLEEGEKQTVETLIKCVVIASGNDAAVAMAEYIAGSEQEFVEMMNKKCVELGMKNTHFEDCSGLTDSDNHYSCARDVALMSRELVYKYPDILNYSSIWMETIIHSTDKGDKEFVLSNTNKLLKANEAVKGLKTGSASKAKYCVSVVAEQNNVKLISVILGASDYKIRFKEANELLKYGFANCILYVDKKNNEINCPVTCGEKEYVSAKKEKEFSYVFPGKMKKVSEKVKLKKIKAPVKIRDKVGVVEYYDGKKMIGNVDLIATQNVKNATFWGQMTKIIQYLVFLD